MDAYEDNLGKSWDYNYVGPAPRNVNPGPIVDFVLSHVKDSRSLLYIGFGSGDNAVPLLDSGLDLWATEVSEMAVERAHAVFPHYQDRLTLGGVSDAYPGKVFAGAVVSRVLMEGSLHAAAERMSAVATRLSAGGDLFLQVPALGTDIWPDWEAFEIDSYGNLIMKYNRDIPGKVYYTSAGVIALCHESGLELEEGPQPRSLPRTSFPGGYVRYWIAKASVPSRSIRR